MSKRTKFGTVALLSLLTLTVCCKRKKVYNEYVTNEAPKPVPTQEPKECPVLPEPKQCSVSEENLICNGSFENSYYNGTGYGILVDGQLECWESKKGIEVQFSDFVAPAVDGDYVVELDTNNRNVEICQTVQVTEGKSYSLSFYYYNRTGDSSSRMTVKVIGRKKAIGVAYSRLFSDFEKYGFDFLADDHEVKICFAGSGSKNGKGAILDAVELKESVYNCENK